MMTATDRMQRILAAPPALLLEIDRVLMEGSTHAAERDLGTCTVADAARRTGFSRPVIYGLINAGRLDVVQLNGARRVTLQSLNELIAGARPADAATVARAEQTRDRRRAVLDANRARRHNRITHTEG